MKILLGYYFFINLLLFLAMAADKFAAVKGSRRIKEVNLWLLAAIGGALGGIIGMFGFKHKTKKPLFYLIFLASLLLHLAILYWLYYLSK